MADKKRVVSLCLSLILVFSFAGCKNKEDIKTEKPNNEIVSGEKAKTENNSIVGTWVVVKTEVYEGPLKAMAEQMVNTYYFVGSEHEYTADGIYKSDDAKLPATQYNILDENQIIMNTYNGESTIYDYELNGDELVQYGNYTGTAVDLGHPMAVYFKRK